MKLKYNPPGIVKNIFKHFHWNTTNDKILLTFDDGPNPGTTEKILILLNQYNIKALFFCVGNNINKNNELTKVILENGHTIGNHTFNHKVLNKLSYKNAKEEIEKTNSLLLNKFGDKIRFFRPPHGKFNFRVKKLISDSGLECVMWSLLTYDYQNDFKKVRFAIDNYLMKNSIIVLHDSNKNKNIIIDSINYIADSVYQKGFQFGETNECLR
ncbi:polysaccharide deacetylase family protein [bacterium BMS3Abin03]|jgi:peptidoglycan/xylan/chitin deacetylase (PgdA/CDA1 family)|nr:polysaccharide deacetylase family protein [bacterium BMS3Abin03]MCG6958730.1 polysaccharide deacetylase family protein [bacterium BMS3Abin03]